MFFGYPIAATQENWLHDSLVTMIGVIHAAHDAGKTPIAWPNIIPLAHRDELASKGGLKDRLANYRKAAKKLTVADRQSALKMMEDQNRIGELLSCAINCGCSDDLPSGIKDSVLNLFEFAYGLLTDLGIRDRHYQIIWNEMPSKMCPFCCDEYFDSPRLAREDYDHYLLKSRYPFAAANLRNLVPMGDKCNRQYKGKVDILHDEASHRRRAFNPYGVYQVHFDLSNSVVYGAEGGFSHSWNIRILPENDECRTWDSVFRLRMRLRENALNELNYHKWLGEFATWFRNEYQLVGHQEAPADTITEATGRYADLEALKAPIPREFLRAHVFRWIHHHCQQPNQRLIQQLQDVIRDSVPPRVL